MSHIIGLLCNVMPAMYTLEFSGTPAHSSGTNHSHTIMGMRQWTYDFTEEMLWRSQVSKYWIEVQEKAKFCCHVVYTEDCEGWWSSGCHSSVAETVRAGGRLAVIAQWQRL